MRNVIFTTLSQKILSNKLLLIATNKQKSNFNNGLILDSVITYYLKSILNVALFN